MFRAAGPLGAIGQFGPWPGPRHGWQAKTKPKTSQHDKTTTHKPTRQANKTSQHDKTTHHTHNTHTRTHMSGANTHTTHMNIRPSATVVRRFPRSHWLKRGQLHDLGGGGLDIRLAPSFALFFRCNGNLICQYSDSSGVFAIFRTM